jgi:hypothetical protein
MAATAFLRDAYCVSTSGVPFASTAQCAQLLSTQGDDVVYPFATHVAF